MSDPTRTAAHANAPRARLATAALAPALAFALASALAGCAAGPSVELESAALDPSNPGVVLVRLRASNPGDEPLPLRVADYSGTIDGRAASAAQRSAEITVPARGQQSFTLPLVAPPLGTTPAAPAAFAVRGSVQWFPPGTIPGFLFDQRWLRPTASFTFSGAVAPPR